MAWISKGEGRWSTCLTAGKGRNLRGEGRGKSDGGVAETAGRVPPCILSITRHAGRMKRFGLLLRCALAARAPAAGENLGALVDKVADAYGGRGALEGMAAVRETGRVEAATRVGSSNAMVRTFARPLKLRVEIGDASKPNEVRVVDGATGWRNGKESTGVGYEAMVLQAVRLDLPFQLLSQRRVLVEKEPM